MTDAALQNLFRDLGFVSDSDELLPLLPARLQDCGDQRWFASHSLLYASAAWI
jgi:hypothetical protein